MSFVKNNVDATNMDFSVCVLYNLYSSLRIYKQHIVSCGVALEDKSYKVNVRCDNSKGKGSYYQYYLHPNALEVFEQALLQDYGIKVNKS